MDKRSMGKNSPILPVTLASFNGKSPPSGLKQIVRTMCEEPEVDI